MERRRKEVICHLTPRGWIVAEGSPLDRVETWHCSVEEAGRSKRYVEWTCMWTNPHLSQSERDELRNRFAESMMVVGRDGSRAQ